MSICAEDCGKAVVPCPEGYPHGSHDWRKAINKLVVHCPGTRRLRAIAERPAESTDDAVQAAAESDEGREP